MALGAPQVAPISLGQYGLPRPDMSGMNTAGGLPIPDLGQGPAQNFLSPAEIGALGGGGRPASGLGQAPFMGGGNNFGGAMQDPLSFFNNFFTQQQPTKPRLYG